MSDSLTFYSSRSQQAVEACEARVVTISGGFCQLKITLLSNQLRQYTGCLTQLPKISFLAYLMKLCKRPAHMVEAKEILSTAPGRRICLCLLIWWMPTANILGRKLVFLATTCLCLATGFLLASIEGTVQWMLNMTVNGIWTSAYQALIQLTVFDMFFVHERGRMLSVYLFAQQLGSILGLISGGRMSDTVGWRWSQNIVGFIFAFVLIAFTFSFEETLFPRFLFAGLQSPPLPFQKDEETAEKSTEGKKLDLRPVSSQANGIVDDFPKRSVLAAIFLVLFGKKRRIAKGPRYYQLLDEVGGYTD